MTKHMKTYMSTNQFSMEIAAMSVVPIATSAKACYWISSLLFQLYLICPAYLGTVGDRSDDGSSFGSIGIPFYTVLPCCHMLPGPKASEVTKLPILMLILPCVPHLGVHQPFTQQSSFWYYPSPWKYTSELRSAQYYAIPLPSTNMHQVLR